MIYFEPKKRTIPEHQFHRCLGNVKDIKNPHPSSFYFMKDKREDDEVKCYMTDKECNFHYVGDTLLYELIAGRI